MPLPGASGTPLAVLTPTPSTYFSSLNAVLRFFSGNLHRSPYGLTVIVPWSIVTTILLPFALAMEKLVPP
ncbi:hypothetical protein F5Y09DRAFT_314816, partial [Xylaria sp. FL1042]